MFTEDLDSSDVLIRVLVVAIVVGGLFMGVSHLFMGRSEAAAKAAPAAVNPRVELGDSFVSVPRRAPQASGASVYECRRDGQTIFSDQPCGSDASIHEIAEPNRMDAQDTRNLYRPVYVAPRAQGGASFSSQLSDTSHQCESIEEQIDAINARMRRAYTSPQGEWFRESLRRLSRQRHEAKCIR